MSESINIIFDGPPGPSAGRFVEIERDDGTGISIGEWTERPNGFWALRICALSQEDNEQSSIEDCENDDALCAICGEMWRDHCFFVPEPKMPPGCACPTAEWGDCENIPPPCKKYVGDGTTACKTCDHDEACHKNI